MQLRHPLFTLATGAWEIVGEEGLEWMLSHQGARAGARVRGHSIPAEPEGPEEGRIATAVLRRMLLTAEGFFLSQDTVETLGDRTIEWLAGDKEDGCVAEAIASSTEVVLGCRVQTLVTVYGERGRLRETRALARAFATTIAFFPDREAFRRAEKAGLRRLWRRSYPYVVPHSYFGGAPVDGLLQLGHGLCLAYAEDFDGICRVLGQAEVAKLGITAGELMIRARENLVARVRGGDVPMQMQRLPDGTKLVIVGAHWLAASCIVLPDLDVFAQKNLGEGPLCVSIPHRDVLFVFADQGGAQRKRMREMIAEGESGGPKPLTMELFTLGPDGVIPLA